MNRELIPQLEPLVERLSGWRGSLVEVVEQLTRSPGTLDRHFTTSSTLVMRLEYVGLAFSGGSLMVLGKAFGRDVGYQATIDLLERLSVGPDAVVFVERFGQVAERHSSFRPLPEAPDAEPRAAELGRYAPGVKDMKRTTIQKTLGITIAGMAVATLVFWGQISEAFGPMNQNELQCLICHRERVEKWVCGSKVRDDIATNEYSEWIDSFTPSNHKHVWLGHTSYNRRYWFGGTSIGCGGIATIPRIYEQRSELGETGSQQLAVKFHQLVSGLSPQIDFGELDRFTQAVVDDPASLLKPDNPH